MIILWQLGHASTPTQHPSLSVPLSRKVWLYRDRVLKDIFLWEAFKPVFRAIEIQLHFHSQL